MSSLRLDRLCPKVPALLMSQPAISPDDALVVPHSTDCGYSVRVCGGRCGTVDGRVSDVGVMTSTGGGVGTRHVLAVESDVWLRDTLRRTTDQLDVVGR